MHTATIKHLQEVTCNGLSNRVVNDKLKHNVRFLPRCMECRRGQRWELFCLSVRPSVRLSNAWIVTKRKKYLSRFVYHTKEHLA